MSSAAQVDVPAPGPPPGLAPLPLRISTSVRVICAAVVVLGLCIAVALVRLSPPSTAQLQAVATTPLPTVQPRNLVQYSAPGFAHRYSYFSADVAPQTLFGEGAPAAHVEAPTTQAKTAAGVVMMGPLAGLVVPIGLALAWLVGRTAGLAGHENAEVLVPLQQLCKAPDSKSMEQLPVAGRRQFLSAAGLSGAALGFLPGGAPAVAAADWKPAVITGQAPDNSTWTSTPRLLKAGKMFGEALAAKTVEEEEQGWTEIIDTFSDDKEEWSVDLLARAWGNRGNARSRQGKLLPALTDYNTAIAIAPYAVDPVLNRGIVMEALNRFDEACQDYRAVLAVDPNDPAAWNNLGNATGGLGRWEEAKDYYGKAASLSPEFAFSVDNYAVTLFQTGDTKNSVRLLRNTLRKYPNFDDARAALAAMLWSLGLYEDAETNWNRVEDIRYKDRVWLTERRRWPPKVTEGLEGLLSLKSKP
eukprot:CAMPEP_0174298944 /NCGR_PEP_ID=MMETSP0809-20121228/55235_1 /TAXON_ID=73025 ORGANISM="Eutreptiella gymnastica-like, Strain CCMP1594" /NCGR_SAMPLE_ID=MMETSP0809 /ASSEMBLY_ACC=CAM_ASM_000658 /LENGTH=470 /DNA_ID=CAMNT_0015403757 /DNA_START=21 /DNA_END=1433 /DNA_ORIENTATION=+